MAHRMVAEVMRGAERYEARGRLCLAAKCYERRLCLLCDVLRGKFVGVVVGATPEGVRERQADAKDAAIALFSHCNRLAVQALHASDPNTSLDIATTALSYSWHCFGAQVGTASDGSAGFPHHGCAWPGASSVCAATFTHVFGQRDMFLPQSVSVVYLVTALNNAGCAALQRKEWARAEALLIDAVKLSSNHSPLASVAYLNLASLFLQRCKMKSSSEAGKQSFLLDNCDSVTESTARDSTSGDDGTSYCSSAACSSSYSSAARSSTSKLLRILSCFALAASLESSSASDAVDLYDIACEHVEGLAAVELQDAIATCSEKYRATLETCRVEQQKTWHEDILREEEQRRIREAEAAQPPRSRAARKGPAGRRGGPAVKKKANSQLAAAKKAKEKAATEGNESDTVINLPELSIRDVALPHLDLTAVAAIRERGLRTVMTSVSLPLDGCTSPAPNDEAAAWNFSIDDSSHVSLAVVVCVETPLQLCTAPPPPRHWLANASAPMASSALTSVSVTVGTAPVAKRPQLPAPPPLVARAFSTPNRVSRSTVDEAKRNLDLAVRALTQRLSTLITEENMFEVKFVATRTIQRAFRKYLRRRREVEAEKCKLAEEERQRAAVVKAALQITQFLRKARASRAAAEEQVLMVLGMENAAATTLQKYVRRWLCQKEAQRRRRERRIVEGQVTKIQSCYRGYAARKRCIQLREVRERECTAVIVSGRRTLAAAKIQTAYRHHRWRIASLIALGRHREAMLHDLQQSRMYYATLIQSTFRRYLARRVYGERVDAVRRIACNSFRSAILNAAATKIQRIFRGYRVRQRTARVLDQWHRHRRTRLRHVHHVTVNRCALVIQCAYRSYRAKQTLKALRHQRQGEWLAALTSVRRELHERGLANPLVACPLSPAMHVGGQ